MRTGSRDVDGTGNGGSEPTQTLVRDAFPQEDRMSVKPIPVPHRNGKGFLWGKEETTRLRALVKEGLERDAIADALSQEFGTSRNSDAVKRRLEALSRPVSEKKVREKRAPGESWPPEQTQRAFELLASGKTYAATTKVLNAEFHVKRTVKALGVHMSKVRAALKASALAKTTPEALAKTKPQEVAVSAKRDRVAVPDGRAISVDFPMGQVRVLLQGELPLSAIRGIAEALVHAAIA